MGEPELNFNLPSGEMERREEVAADELIPQSTVIIRTSCSSRRSLNNVDTSNIRRTWPNGFSLIRWAHYERLMGGPRDPEAAAEKLWRKREKRLRRAQLENFNAHTPMPLPLLNLRFLIPIIMTHEGYWLSEIEKVSVRVGLHIQIKDMNPTRKKYAEKGYDSNSPARRFFAVVEKQ
ncbi:hypothetical protein DCAR_0729309 [Daucus carota subsp. sativus]|uniref:Uncharacterized protein n=1 Tax=Daucus carota subsp. sativus TaxID=79200 RepID=A0A161ZM74_DAUCS|nr:hypothetical protein DCAR_0729309 [Daucus carota subsp. sativus]